MGGNMQDIKHRINSISSIKHITNAMKLVSAAKLRRAKEKFDKNSEYVRSITATIEDVFKNSEERPSRYIKSEAEIKKICFVVITGNKGLCGTFNSNVIKEAESLMRKCEDSPELITIGTKGREYFAKRGYSIYKEYLEPAENISIGGTKEIVDAVLELYDKEIVDEVVVVYTAFKNNIEQEVVTKKVLPLTLYIDEKEEYCAVLQDIEYEPSPEAVFNYLVPKYVGIKLYGTIVESATCEHAARRMAMENATDNAKEMLEKLSVFYHRARQTAITNEIIEVVSGAEAQK